MWHPGDHDIYLLLVEPCQCSLPTVRVLALGCCILVCELLQCEYLRLNFAQMHRVRSLAEGAVVHKFQWSGGGEWAGKAWSAELPTDTALLLFLFSAFLAVWPPVETASAAPLAADYPLLQCTRTMYQDTLTAFT